MGTPRGGRPPRDQTRAAGVTCTEFIPIHQFNGVPNSVWQPASTAEAVTFLWYNPKWLPEYATNFRVLWSTAGTTAADTITPRIRYKAVTTDTDAVAVGTTALDTAIAADNCTTTADSLMRSAAGVLNAGTASNGDALALTLDISAVSGITLGAAAADNVNVYGLEIEYVPAWLD